MKTIKILNRTLYAGAVFMLLTAVFSFLGASDTVALTGAGASMIASSLVPAVPGILAAGVYREIWTGEILKYMTAAEKASFLDGIPDYSQYVATVDNEMQVINLSSMDVLPDVLINNNTYPIALQTMDFTNIPISLDKYQTKRTPITDDELFAMAPAKMSAVKERHGIAMATQKLKKALHALSPTGNTADMPVLLTTGADDGTGRKKLTWADMLTWKRALDNLEWDEANRLVVLCTDHENDLASEDQTFKDKFYNRADGKPYNQLGFQFDSHISSPYFSPGTKNRVSFGAVPAGTDRKASICYLRHRMRKATGWTKMYFKAAKDSPDTQQNEINFRHYFIALPTQTKHRSAIISDNV